MIITPIASSQGEGDFIPEGLQYAVNVPGQGLVITNGVVIPFPPGETALRYPALATDGSIAGQSQAHVQGAWVVEPWNQTWSIDPREPAGTNPVIYDQNNVLYVNVLGAGYAGSNGYRYVNPSNVVITGDATYAARNGVAEWIDLSLAQDGSLLVGYAAWALACVVWDGTHHRLITEGNAYRLRAHRSGDVVTLAITHAGQCLLIQTTAQELVTLPIYEPPPPIPPDPTVTVGPTTPPNPADGTIYDLGPCFLSDGDLQPRTGPDQINQQVDLSNGVTQIQKFGSTTVYESLAMDANWIYDLEDASDTTSQSWTDPRWWPRHLPIGEQYAFRTGSQTALRRTRGSCQVVSTIPFDNRFWLHAVWDDGKGGGYDWGPELGNRPTQMLVYDNTAGIHTEGRIVEVHLNAKGAGWCEWQAHRSDVVFQSGKAVFSDASLVQRTQFYRVGGAFVPISLTGCVPQVCPSYPPLNPIPPQPIAGDFPMLDPKTMILYASKKASSKTGCTNYMDVDGTVFSCQPDGSIAKRPAGTDGNYEQFQESGNLATCGPKGSFYAFGVASIASVL